MIQGHQPKTRANKTDAGLIRDVGGLDDLKFYYALCWMLGFMW